MVTDFIKNGKGNGKILMFSRAVSSLGPVLVRRGSPAFAARSMLSQSSRWFSLSNETAFKVEEAVQDFVNMRREELEQYQPVDEHDKQETVQLLEKLTQAKVDSNTTWASLGFDGLDEVELILAIEETLGVHLPDDEFHSIHSVADAVKVIEKYLPKQG
jgi:acyl carrier protein